MQASTLGSAIALMLLLGVPAAHAGQDTIKVVNEGGIRDAWMLAEGVPLAAPGYPAAFATRGDDVCVAMGYRIARDGSTSDYTVLRTWSSAGAGADADATYWDAFARASAGALSQWRFQPRPEAGSPRPVDTVATMTFSGGRGEGGASLRAHCRVDDLPGLLAQVRRERHDRRDLNSHQIEVNMTQTMRNLTRANQIAREMKEDR
jgi:hypothetical protein